MGDSTARRLKGPRVVTAFVAILAITVVTTLAFFFRASEHDGRVLALRAEGERSALLLREARGKKKHVRLLRFIDGEQPNKISLFGVQPGAVPFVIGDRVVVEAMTARGYPTIQAFDVKDLSFAYWGPEPSKSLEDGARGATLVASLDGRPVVVSVHRGSPGELLVADASDGAELLRVPLEGVASPASLQRVGEGAVRIGLEGGGFTQRDLRSGGEVEGGEPARARPRCEVRSGRLFHDDRELGELAVGSFDALLDLEEGCLIRRDARFEVRAAGAPRAFEVLGGSIAPTVQPHVSGASVFLVVDEKDVAVVDLNGPEVRPSSLGLSVRPLPSAD